MTGKKKIHLADDFFAPADKVSKLTIRRPEPGTARDAPVGPHPRKDRVSAGRSSLRRRPTTDAEATNIILGLPAPQSVARAPVRQTVRRLSGVTSGAEQTPDTARKIPAGDSAAARSGSAGGLFPIAADLIWEMTVLAFRGLSLPWKLMLSLNPLRVPKR